MNEFSELDLPKKATLGWYVVSMSGTVDYLHDDGQIHKGTCDQFYISSGYFSTEYDAHQAAERYYLTHGRKYPYTTLLNASSRAVVVNNSQVMDFG